MVFVGSGVTVAVRDGVGVTVFVGSDVTVAVRDGVGVTVFVGRGVLVGTANSICNKGAPAGAPSYALAVR